MFHGFRSLIQLLSLFSGSEGASVPHPYITVRAQPVYTQVIPNNRTGGEVRVAFIVTCGALDRAISTF
jgi:hypothetical protein